MSIILSGPTLSLAVQEEQQLQLKNISNCIIIIICETLEALESQTIPNSKCNSTEQSFPSNFYVQIIEYIIIFVTSRYPINYRLKIDNVSYHL